MRTKAPEMATQKEKCPFSLGLLLVKVALGACLCSLHWGPSLGDNHVPGGCLSLCEVTLSLIGSKMGPLSIKQGPVSQNFWTWFRSHAPPAPNCLSSGG